MMATLEPLASGLLAGPRPTARHASAEPRLIDEGAVERIVRDIRAFCRQHRPAQME